MSNLERYANECEIERLERQMQDDFLSYIEFDEDFDVVDVLKEVK